MKVLLTGIGGFLGTHCFEYFLEKTDWEIIGIDSFRNKGMYSRINEVKYDINRLRLYNHDLGVPIDSVLEKRIGDIDIIINMASDSAVERSILNPVGCLRNNVELGINMLEYARRVKPKMFVQFSTDEVYGDSHGGIMHREWDVMKPSSAYAASKGMQELLAMSYWRTYNVPVVITNTVNCIGEMQDVEKFLPKLIWKISTDQVMEIYGSKEEIGSRFYLYSKNVADALIFLSKREVSSYLGGGEIDRYNIVGDLMLNNLEVGEFVSRHMKKDLRYKFVPYEEARPGYDRSYGLDGSKLRDLGWVPPISTKDGLVRVIDWTLANSHWLTT